MESVDAKARSYVKNPNLPQLYTVQTMNGLKAALMVSELHGLKELDGDSFDFETHTVDIRHAESRSKDFMRISPAGKIPALVDFHGPNNQEIDVFESGSILLYLAEKHECLLPKDLKQRYETINWLFFASASFTPQAKLFAHYYYYCHHKLDYCIDRYTNEVMRLLAVIETQLHGKDFLVGDPYSVADVALFPVIYALINYYGDAFEHAFGGFAKFPLTLAWYHRIGKRPAFQRALEMNNFIA